MRYVIRLGLAVALALAPVRSSAQQVFHSVQSANLPTAEILPRGSWLFEISHRFGTPVSEGASALWGLDGPVFNRLGLSYVAAERVQLGVLRSNAADNVDLNVKVGILSSGESMPVKAAIMGGVAFNTQVNPVEGAEDNESQQYVQLLLNALIADRFAVGLVPTYLRNQRIRDFDVHQAVVVGVHGQLYLTPSMSVLAEWIVTPARTGVERDPASFGVEFETRGHFFKLLATNQVRLNPTQVLAGSGIEFTPDEWMLGFNITRLLPF